MTNKLTHFFEDREYLLLDENNREYLEKLNGIWQFSYQENRILIRIARDLETWDEGALAEYWEGEASENPGGKNEKEKYFKKLNQSWNRLKDNPKSYTDFHHEKIKHTAPGFLALKDERTILGDCPVASSKTRCCNLKTLDAVINCGFDCTYCSIQSFYHDDHILFHKNIKEKLQKLKLDPEKKYHIGTGQSSDSLMWGNKEGILEEVIEFARENPNVILELKTKSDNITDLLKLQVPPNVLATWSLNTQTVISSEERLTASLEQRLNAARKVADRGIPVGFHLHPMVWYEGWKAEYQEMIDRITAMFSPEEVVTISLGTLTFIKPVLKLLRKRPIKSKILQMPMDEAAGKWSYPLSIKQELFRTAYEAFKPWHESVYFYMCMEDPSLWKAVFGREYPSNENFEEDMLYTYHRKIKEIARRNA
ncbi:MAG: hypothetical protein B6241_10570 [Spirochaetaceae bacterium 4572_59]|nr:MAG: hypothetical protein B6241_10570 [Spirochaetaceae bacterium 4572_59]